MLIFAGTTMKSTWMNLPHCTTSAWTKAPREICWKKEKQEKEKQESDKGRER